VFFVNAATRAGRPLSVFPLCVVFIPEFVFLIDVRCVAVGALEKNSGRRKFWSLGEEAIFGRAQFGLGQNLEAAFAIEDPSGHETWSLLRMRRTRLPRNTVIRVFEDQ
jgi:hypothetical protein